MSAPIEVRVLQDAGYVHNAGHWMWVGGMDWMRGRVVRVVPDDRKPGSYRVTRELNPDLRNGPWDKDNGWYLNAEWVIPVRMTDVPVVLAAAREVLV